MITRLHFLGRKTHTTCGDWEIQSAMKLERDPRKTLDWDEDDSPVPM